MKYLFLFLLSTSAAWSYPIYFSCNNKGQLNDFVTSSDFDEVLRDFIELPDDKQNKQIAKWCAGEKECMDRLKQMADLAKVNKALLQSELNQNHQKIKKEITQVAPGTGEIYKQLKSFENLMACEETMKDLPASSFKNKRNEVLAYYPFDSNYKYVAGCNGFYCNFMREAEIKQLINQAVSMGADPYATIGLSLMEQGTSQMNGLYLDPIGKIKALGCKFVDADSNTPGAMDSFSTYYKVEPSKIDNPSLAQGIQTNLKVNNIKTTPGKSYYCLDPQTGYSSVSDDAPKDKCCLQLPFKSKGTLAKDSIENAMVYDHIRDLLSRPPKEKDPAFAIQHFNGYSKLMGGAERVQTFRMGVNYYETPAYGYQVMDYLLNSLHSNPLINALVKQTETKAGKKSQSVLCLGQKEGHFMVDSDTYFDKHKNAKRLGIIEQKFKDGKSFNDLTAKEKKVLSQEITDEKVQPLFSNSKIKKGSYEIYEANQSTYEYYFKNIYSKRDTVAEASRPTGYSYDSYSSSEWPAYKTRVQKAFYDSK